MQNIAFGVNTRLMECIYPPAHPCSIEQMWPSPRQLSISTVVANSIFCISHSHTPYCVMKDSVEWKRSFSRWDHYYWNNHFYSKPNHEAVVAITISVAEPFTNAQCFCRLANRQSLLSSLARRQDSFNARWKGRWNRSGFHWLDDSSFHYDWSKEPRTSVFDFLHISVENVLARGILLAGRVDRAQVVHVLPRKHLWKRRTIVASDMQCWRFNTEIQIHCCQWIWRWSAHDIYY